MKNRKQLLADFYLELLAIQDDAFRSRNFKLYIAIKAALVSELESDPDTIGHIFERMAAEDSK